MIQQVDAKNEEKGKPAVPEMPSRFVVKATKVCPSEHGGSYVVCVTPLLVKESVTFDLSLLGPLEQAPESGTLFVIEELRQKVAGWRAMKARFFMPADDLDDELTKQKERIQSKDLRKGSSHHSTHGHSHSVHTPDHHTSGSDSPAQSAEQNKEGAKV